MVWLPVGLQASRPWPGRPYIHQQRFDAMGVDHRLARRPGEDGKTPVLRRDEGDRVALIVDELRRGQVSGAAELRRMDDRGDPALDRFRHRHLLDER
jgi:hypothetical protein